MGLSLEDRVARLSKPERDAWIAEQPLWMLEEMARGSWWWVARPEQVPPPGGWLVCLALAGRGFGKSRAGSEWIVERSVQHPFDASGTPTERLVIAETLSDARTICMEGPAGVLRALDRRKVKYRYKMSPRPMVLFPNGSKIYTEGADSPDVGRGYNASDAWLDEICIAAGELVRTDRGDVPVETVTTDDQVLTRQGFRPVTWSGLSRSGAKVLRLVTAHGDVRVTPDHRVFTADGWVRADRLRPGSIIYTCITNSIETLLPVSNPATTPGTAKSGTTTNAPGTTTTGTGFCFTEPSGPKFTDRFQRATKSITLTATDSTTAWSTSSCSPSPSTGHSLRVNEKTNPGNGARLPLPRRSDSLIIGSNAKSSQSSATSAGRLSTALACAPNGALMSAVESTPVPTVPTVLLDVTLESEPVDVYDITVGGDAPEFFVGSGAILVHNCKWRAPRQSWYEGIMPSLRADIIGDHPRAFVTTTPKPVDLLTEWVKRDDDTIHIIRGSTFDNSKNLSKLVMAELLKRYEGTAIGRQELYGEILEALDGALFTRLDLANYRVAEAPYLVSTVVGVDPALTGEDDEMGVVVAGRDVDNHMYVLEDASILAVGRAAALHAWRVFAQWGADVLLYEANLGKGWMEQVFRDAYYELVGSGLFPAGSTPPCKPVDARRGKKTRAEPVAMRSEQGKLHLVGNFPMLEDQLATFCSWDTKESPDRLDAMVHACRHLMLGERKQSRLASPVGLSSTLSQLWRDTDTW